MTYKPCFSCCSLIYILLLTHTLWALFCGQLNNQSSAQGVAFKCCHNQSELFIFFTITRSWSIVAVTADWSTQSFDHCCTSIKAIAFIITWLWLWLNKNWDEKYSDLQRRFEDYLNCLKIMFFIFCAFIYRTAQTADKQRRGPLMSYFWFIGCSNFLCMDLYKFETTWELINNHNVKIFMNHEGKQAEKITQFTLKNFP